MNALVRHGRGEAGNVLGCAANERAVVLAHHIALAGVEDMPKRRRFHRVSAYLASNRIDRNRKFELFRPAAAPGARAYHDPVSFEVAAFGVLHADAGRPIQERQLPHCSRICIARQAASNART